MAVATPTSHTGLWLQQAVLSPCRALPVPSFLPGHHRAAASPESCRLWAGTVPCTPSCHCHLEHGAVPSPLQPSHALVAPGHWAAIGILTQPLPAPVEINPGPGSVSSTLAVVFQLFVQLPLCHVSGAALCHLQQLVMQPWESCQRQHACPRAVNGDNQPFALSSPMQVQVDAGLAWASPRWLKQAENQGAT